MIYSLFKGQILKEKRHHTGFRDFRGEYMTDIQGLKLMLYPHGIQQAVKVEKAFSYPREFGPAFGYKGKRRNLLSSVM